MWWSGLAEPWPSTVYFRLVQTNYVYKAFSYVRTLYKTLPKWLRHVNYMWFELNEYIYWIMVLVPNTVLWTNRGIVVANHLHYIYSDHRSTKTPTNTHTQREHQSRPSRNIQGMEEGEAEMQSGWCESLVVPPENNTCHKIKHTSQLFFDSFLFTIIFCILVSNFVMFLLLCQCSIPSYC